MRDKIFNDIVLWIEENLSKKIRAEDIETISGYSARHVSGLFRLYAGLSLGRYIRQRRLCRAAYLLRLTGKKIIDIACQLHFDSQQSFSREFRKLFGCSPKEYRQSSEWDFSLLLSPCFVEKDSLLTAEFCTLPERVLYGYAVNYHETIIMELPFENNALRHDVVVRNLRYCRRDIIMCTRYRPVAGELDKLNIHTFVGVDKSPANSRILTKEYYSDGGEYIRLFFSGTWGEYSQFVRKVYHCVLPAMNAIRRDGDEIEHFLNVEGDNEAQVLSCYYYIPVFRT